MDPILINLITALVSFSGGLLIGRQHPKNGLVELSPQQPSSEPPPITINIEGSPAGLEEFLHGLSDEEIESLMSIFDNEDFPPQLGIDQTVTKYVTRFLQERTPRTPSDSNILDRPEPLVLRPFQEEAVDALSRAVKGIVQLPTGTGKSIVLFRAIVREIEQNAPAVYVILSPKILLSNQLMLEVRKDLLVNDIDCDYAIIHSDKTRVEEDDDVDLEWFKAEAGNLFPVLPEATTDVQTLQRMYKASVARNVPLVIACTYHSAGVIMDSGIPVYFTGCDEAHRLAQLDGNERAQILNDLLEMDDGSPNKITENWAWIVDSFISKKKYFFTATLRVTDDENLHGMNNVDRFGEVLYSKSPKEMIDLGEMVQPALHRVDIDGKADNPVDDIYAVVEAFKRHRAEINTGAKLLVVARRGNRNGSYLETLAQSDEIKRLRYTHPNLTVFDISSRSGPRIDGKPVTRPKFLKELRELGKDSSREAIIIHINILTEGIDVPGITGVMFFAAPQKIKFMQTIGRASRLHSVDRQRLYSGEIVPGQLDFMVKPACWVIIPQYNDQKDRFTEITIPLVRRLRDDYNFDPNQNLIVGKFRGQSVRGGRKGCDSDISLIELDEFNGTVMHEVERIDVDERVHIFEEKVDRVKTIEDLIGDIDADDDLIKF